VVLNEVAIGIFNFDVRIALLAQFLGSAQGFIECPANGVDDRTGLVTPFYEVGASRTLCHCVPFTGILKPVENISKGGSVNFKRDQ
jgi:hypothetical protein